MDTKVAGNAFSMTVGTTIPTEVTGALIFTYEAHACRWCGEHYCADRTGHERLFMQGDSYARMTVAQRNKCSACSGDVRVGQCEVAA